MKTKTVSALLVAAAAFVSVPALADNAAQQAAERSVALADGGTLYIFADGKMAKANRFGDAEYLQIGDTLKTSDGKSVQVTSNEVAHLRALLLRGHEG